MAQSRLRRFEEKRAQKRLFYAAIGSLALLVFLFVFGLRILVGFSLMVDRLRGGSPPQQQQTIVLPPVLDPLPEATNSSTLTVSGKGETSLELILYVNEKEHKKLKLPSDGVFSVKDIPVEEGQVAVSAKQSDGKGNLSELSNVVTTIIKRTPPKLVVSTPVDGDTIRDPSRKAAVEGVTEEDAHLTVNGRIVVVRLDGSFRYDALLSDGENTLTIIATDRAGNETKVERKVTYQP